MALGAGCAYRLLRHLLDAFVVWVVFTRYLSAKKRIHLDTRDGVPRLDADHFPDPDDA